MATIDFSGIPSQQESPIDPALLQHIMPILQGLKQSEIKVPNFVAPPDPTKIDIFSGLMANVASSEANQTTQAHNASTQALAKAALEEKIRHDERTEPQHGTGGPPLGQGTQHNEIVNSSGSDETITPGQINHNNDEVETYNTGSNNSGYKSKTNDNNDPRYNSVNAIAPIKSNNPLGHLVKEALLGIGQAGIKGIGDLFGGKHTQQTPTTPITPTTTPKTPPALTEASQTPTNKQIGQTPTSNTPSSTGDITTEDIGKTPIGNTTLNGLLKIYKDQHGVFTPQQSAMIVQAGGGSKAFEKEGLNTDLTKPENAEEYLKRWYKVDHINIGQEPKSVVPIDANLPQKNQQLQQLIQSGNNNNTSNTNVASNAAATLGQIGAGGNTQTAGTNTIQQSINSLGAGGSTNTQTAGGGAGTNPMQTNIQSLVNGGTGTNAVTGQGVNPNITNNQTPPNPQATTIEAQKQVQVMTPIQRRIYIGDNTENPLPQPEVDRVANFVKRIELNPRLLLGTHHQTHSIEMQAINHQLETNDAFNKAYNNLFIKQDPRNQQAKDESARETYFIPNTAAQNSFTLLGQHAFNNRRILEEQEWKNTFGDEAKIEKDTSIITKTLPSWMNLIKELENPDLTRPGRNALENMAIDKAIVAILEQPTIKAYLINSISGSLSVPDKAFGILHALWSGGKMTSATRSDLSRVILAEANTQADRFNGINRDYIKDSINRNPEDNQLTYSEHKFTKVFLSSDFNEYTKNAIKDIKDIESEIKGLKKQGYSYKNNNEFKVQQLTDLLAHKRQLFNNEFNVYHKSGKNPNLIVGYDPKIRRAIPTAFRPPPPVKENDNSNSNGSSTESSDNDSSSSNSN